MVLIRPNQRPKARFVFVASHVVSVASCSFKPSFDDDEDTSYFQDRSDVQDENVADVEIDSSGSDASHALSSSDSDMDFHEFASQNVSNLEGLNRHVRADPSGIASVWLCHCAVGRSLSGLCCYRVAVLFRAGASNGEKAA